MAEKFIPQYVADKVLGEGAFGRVYLIHNQRAEDFALKVVLPKFQGAEGGLEEEVKILSRLSHANLLAIHEYIPQVGSLQGVEEKGSGYVMDYVEGKSLEELGEETSFEEWENYLVQCFRGLHYLHTRHLLHGDLKPANLRLGKKKYGQDLGFWLGNPTGRKRRSDFRDPGFYGPRGHEGETNAPVRPLFFGRGFLSPHGG